MPTCSPTSANSCAPATTSTRPAASRDALILVRVNHFDLLLVGPALTASPTKLHAFHAASAKYPVIELGTGFLTDDVGAAGASLLEEIEAVLSSKLAKRQITPR